MSATSISQSETVSVTFCNSVAGLYLKHILTVMSKTGSLPEPIPVNLIVQFWMQFIQMILKGHSSVSFRPCALIWGD